MLEIKNLTVRVDDKTILDGLNLTVKTGEVAAIMGPNGSGKSTLSYVVAGRPDYEVLDGEVLLNGENILAMEPDERAAAGVFLAFQYPLEIPGVGTMTFLKAALNAQLKAKGMAELTTPEFIKRVNAAAASLEIPKDMLKRALNVGFSGGEKKRMEILQMALLLHPRRDRFRARHRRAQGRRRRRQRAALARALLPRHHALPAPPQPHRARQRARHGERPHRALRRARARARARGERLCRVQPAGGRVSR